MDQLQLLMTLLGTNISDISQPVNLKMIFLSPHLGYVSSPEGTMKLVEVFCWSWFWVVLTPEWLGFALPMSFWRWSTRFESTHDPIKAKNGSKMWPRDRILEVSDLNTPSKTTVTWNLTIPLGKGETSTNHHFLGSILILGVYVYLISCDHFHAWKGTTDANGVRTPFTPFESHWHGRFVNWKKMCPFKTAIPHRVKNVKIDYIMEFPGVI